MSSTSETRSVDVEKTARFIHVDPEPGGIVVIGGHLLSRWTNRRYADAVHRVAEHRPVVVERSSDAEAEDADDAMEMIPERYSIVFFSFPDAETIVQPFASCCGDGNPSKYQTINASEFRLKKRGYPVRMK